MKRYIHLINAICCFLLLVAMSIPATQHTCCIENDRPDPFSGKLNVLDDGSIAVKEGAASDTLPVINGKGFIEHEEEARQLAVEQRFLPLQTGPEGTSLRQVIHPPKHHD